MSNGPAPGDEDAAASRGVVACLVDDHPRLHEQALRWFATLTRCAGVAAGALAVFDAGAGGRASPVLAYLEGRGVRVRRIARFDPRFPATCNKIAALAAAAAATEGLLVFSDCDLAFLGDPRAHLSDPEALHAGPVHRPKPPLEMLGELLAARGLPLGETHALALYPDQRTCMGNANGGLYVVQAALARALAADWAREARWLLEERSELLEMWYVDQVAMLLALRTGGRRFRALPLGANLPTGDPGLGRVAPEAMGPLTGLHYHAHLTPEGLLKAPGVAHIDAAIARANAAIAEEYRQFALAGGTPPGA